VKFRRRGDVAGLVFSHRIREHGDAYRHLPQQDDPGYL
jgi:hypothetical protein